MSRRFRSNPPFLEIVAAMARDGRLGTYLLRLAVWTPSRSLCKRELTRANFPHGRR